MPFYRIELIFQNLHPQVLICDKETQKQVKENMHQNKEELDFQILSPHSIPIPLKDVQYNQLQSDDWVVSALTMISSLGVLDKVKPEYLKTIAFGSEVFPIKQFQKKIYICFNLS